jgi:carboxypeptidase Q
VRTGVLLSICCGVLLLAQAPDADLLARMRSEALDRSQVAPVFDMLTVNIGPRLTASPAHKRAAEFARDWLASHGLENARLEAFQFGRGWTLEKLTLEMIEPRYLPLIGYADGWSPSTRGEISAAPVSVAGKSPEEIDAMRARLKGSIVMTAPTMSNFVRQDRPQPSDANYVSRPAADRPAAGGRGAAQRLRQALRDAEPAVLLKPSRGEHGTVFVTGRDEGPGAPPSVTLSAEHYNMVAQLLEHNVAVKLRIQVQSHFYDADAGKAYNVLAELSGSDPALRDEIVMIGAHLDSWHTGVGATDNADGSTTVMEAMRILKAIGARPRRTIRVALWGGEEQGLLGSKAWVAAHLAGDANTAARARFDVYFNIDNGTGPIYGWYLENREAARPIFDAWLEPMKAFGARRNTLEPITNTDHVTFNDAGVPGFNPIQDYINYDVRTHHTNMDTVDRLQIQDIRQAAMVMAWFAYRAAMVDQEVPGIRK